MTLKTVTVDLGHRSYPIIIGPGALQSAASEIATIIGQGQAVIIADENLWRLHSDRVMSVLGELPVILVPPGEGSKSFTEFARVSEALLAAGVGRDGTIIALGGGVIGDLAGFCAASLRRGCQFIQIPTTLLAQVDSSVGGKTGINASSGKNLVGAFHQPRLVVADTDILATLPLRELRAGYAEIVKYGLLGDAAFFDWLQVNGEAVIAQDIDALTEAVRISCEAKAATVAADETEQGRRALLNLGHTFGHALEAAMGYDGRLLHGEGVAAGMGMAFRFSAAQGLCGENAVQAVEQHLTALSLPTGPKAVKGLATDAAAQLNFMYQDKKVEGGRLTLILARGIGDAFVQKNVDPQTVVNFLEEELQ
ncbi:MAG: 3-dehydroquinate synthase [Pseudomonadota bacterium]